MSTYRSIQGVFHGAPFHMVGDGFRMSNYFPAGNQFNQRVSPFILLDYGAPYHFPASDQVRGVGAHPHRGFETVTIAYEGSFEHHDNHGNHGIIRPGDVQWMTAGSGVLHKEYQEKSFAEQGGVAHVIQLWVNLPKEHKMTQPKYQELSSTSMGRVDLHNAGGSVRVIAGEYEGVKGPAQTFTPIHLFDINLNSGGVAHFTLPESFNTSLMVLKGEVKVNEELTAKATDFILLSNVSGSIHVEGLTEDALVLVLSGQPIHETIIQYGPFVMNTKQEIIQAYDDYENGQFGDPNF